MVRELTVKLWALRYIGYELECSIKHFGLLLTAAILFVTAAIFIFKSFRNWLHAVYAAVEARSVIFYHYVKIHQGRKQGGVVPMLANLVLRCCNM